MTYYKKKDKKKTKETFYDSWRVEPTTDEVYNGKK